MAALSWFILLLAIMGVGTVIGLAIAEMQDEDTHEALMRREAKVRADMDALTRAQHLNTAFLAARRAMWDEAMRHRAPGPR